MSEKVVLILVDGMRPDAMLQCGHAFPARLMKASTYTLNAATVMPSVTLPCHMSLFHSVDPDRHGVMTNTYTPQVRPIDGMFDQFHRYKKKCGFFYSWEQLRDLCRPGRLHSTVCFNLGKQTEADKKLTDFAIPYIKSELPDFTFLYLGETDESGHANAWMSDGYMETLRIAWDCIEKVYENLPEGYTLIVTADHGGHARTHGTDLPEDMTIPMLVCGARFAENKEIDGVSIKDIAPTVATLLDVPFVEEWEGKVLPMKE
ncbi:MAG: alkaline phosphatase family protein [Clostridia bacterium]|nr:alkaline phosphatase family protein [Clostridia bacterium]